MLTDTTITAGMRALFLFAHPDDEVGCMGVIEAIVSNAGTALCVFLTDGRYGGQAAEPRMTESRRALGRLGVRDDQIHFVGVDLNIPDGQLHRHLPRVIEWLGPQVLGSEPLGCIFVPAWEGGHQDHDATHIVGLALGAGPEGRVRCLQFPLYHGRGLPGSLFRVLSPIPENGPVTAFPIPLRRRIRYVAMCLGYPSQWKTWLALFPFVAAILLLRGSYRMQLADSRRLAERPHPGPLLYERRRACSRDEFLAETQAVVQRFLPPPA